VQKAWSIRGVALMFNFKRITLLKRRSIAIVALCLGAVGVSAVWAAESPEASVIAPESNSVLIGEKAAAGIGFASPLEAYRQGKAAFDEGWYGLALPALRYAAARGVFGAQLKLAKMYEFGLGVIRNDAAAFKLYERVSGQNWNISSFHPAAPYIGQALSALGVYHLNGVPDMQIEPNERRAARYFMHAAQYFGDPRGQTELARLYLSGQGISKNTRRAVGWLNNAARKRYAPAQALLGQLLWQGEIVKKRQVKALALLTLAQENASPQDADWISELYDTVTAEANPNDMRRAEAVADRWVRIVEAGKKMRRRIIVQKEVRIGIAKDGRMKVETRERAKAAPAKPKPEQQWIGAGSFQPIGVK
jgi:TPR repeat protein